MNFIQNHDQVANSLGGARHPKTDQSRKVPGINCIAAAFTRDTDAAARSGIRGFITVPLFCRPQPRTGEFVAKGRKEFLEQFESLKCPETEKYLEQPEKEETFLKCKLDFSEREKHASIYNLHKDLLQLRATDSVISEACFGKIDGAVLGEESFALRIFF